MSAEIRHGNCLDVLAVAARAGERYHAVVTDPPYHLTSIQKRFGKEGSAPAQHGRDGSFARLSKGFMGRTWDGGDVAFRPETWKLVYDVLYPGAHMAVFGGTRTFHRMAVAIEDAGFEVRDEILWLYATGFPKSANISRQIDKTLGKSGAVDPKGNPVARMIPGADQAKDGWAKTNGREYQPGDYVPATPEGAAWSGYGTSLKPAHEPILLVRKPLEGTVARNVLAHGVGGLNIDGCRVPMGTDYDPTKIQRQQSNRQTWEGGTSSGFSADHEQSTYNPAGRWPPNILHDGSPEVLEAFGRFGEKTSGKAVAGGHRRTTGTSNRVALDDTLSAREDAGTLYGDSGSAARFFPALGYTEDELLHNALCTLLWSWDVDIVSETETAEASCLSVKTAAESLSASTDGGGSESTADGFAPGNISPSAEAKPPRPSECAEFVERLSGRLLRTAENTVPSSARRPADESPARGVKSAGTRSPLPGTSTVQNLALRKIKSGRDLKELFINATASELLLLAETVTATMRSLEAASSCGVPQPKLSLQNSRAKSVATRQPTGITTITVSHWLSDGSAGRATFNITPKSEGPGVPGCGNGLRFRYSSKANKAERMGSQHPTVKPIALLRWLARLITPPGGRILDPFAGTGTTGAAARAEGFGFTGIEMTDEYVEDCIRRLPEATVDRGPWGLDLRDALARNRAAHDKLAEALRRTSVRNPGEAA